MRYFNWILRTVLFIALLGLAIKNDQQVKLSYFFGFEWQTPLVVVLLVFFVVGIAVGVLAMLTDVLRQQREIARLKRDINLNNKFAGMDETQKIPIQPS